MLNSIASRFLKNTDVLLLASLATLSVTGGYNVAWKLAVIARYGDQILTNTLQPRISKYLAAGEISELRREFNQVRDLSVVAVIPILIIILLFGKPLLAIFGDYTGQFSVLLILTVGAGINASFGTIGQILLMGKEGRLVLINTLISLFGNLLLNILLIPQYGAVGAALATTFTVFFLTNLVAAIEVKYYLHIDTFDLITLGLVLLLSVSVVATMFEIIPVLLTTIFSLAIAGTLVYRRYTFVSEVFQAYRVSL
jgi:O-antigen/teichoic acid export membrane protein